MNLDKYRVTSGKGFKLKDFDPDDHGGMSKEDVNEEVTQKILDELFELQQRLYAENERSLLIILQAMDAAGKDGLIKHVMRGLNPQGCSVVSFKQPSSEELDRDYLWRINRGLPRRGEIGIFNRSHYEEVLVTRVHKLVAKQQLPDELITDKIWKQRYRQIGDYERYLYENGITPIKIFLNVSKEEQRQRLLERINNPDKNWKFSSFDVEERKNWDEYQKAYQDMIEATSTEEAPWYILPADRKWYARYLFANIVKAHLEKMNPRYPELDDKERAKLGECRTILESQEEDDKKDGH